MRKLIISLLSIILILTPFSTSFANYESMPTNENESDTNEAVKVILLEIESSTPIYLFADINDNDIIARIPDRTEAIVVKSDNEGMINERGFEFIEVELENEVYRGYVEIKHINMYEDPTNDTEEQTDIKDSDEEKSQKEKSNLLDTELTEEVLREDETSSTEDLDINDELTEELQKDTDKSISTLTESKKVSKQLSGVALDNHTAVYSSRDKGSKQLKKYKKGHVLKFRNYNKNWYVTGVFINGKKETGYIYVNDVGTMDTVLSDYAVKSPTNVYSSTNRNSKVLRSYAQGRVLKYRGYNNNWYVTGVIINGKKETGYIHKNDVSTTAPLISGYATKNPTRVYASANRNSKVVRSYNQGSSLKYRYHNSNWYTSGAFVNGKKQTIYIHKNDVSTTAPLISGYATKNPTRVYASANRNSRVVRSYSQGSSLKYRYHNSNWYTSGAFVNGKKQTIYIHKNDVSTTAPLSQGYAAKNPTRVYTNTNRNSKVIKSYKKAANLKVRSYNSSWYQATVYVKGKAQRGYIHKSDFTTKKLSKVDKLTTIDNNNQLILVTSKGYNTTRVNIETYERGKDGLWKRKLSTRGYIGINGFAKNKREGDGKSPTGKYTIGDAFAQHPNPGTKLNFRRITSDDVWVDDSKSSLYNTWQKRSKTKHLWNSAENMNHRLYKYGFVINYNTKREPYKGSAIFFHIGNSYTVGCTATSQTNVISMLKWLDPSKKPVIIQTPESELNKY